MATPLSSLTLEKAGAAATLAVKTAIRQAQEA